MDNRKRDDFEDLKCPRCKTKDIYTRIKTWERVCKKCGYSWEVKEGVV